VRTYHLPAIGAAIALCFFILAASYYPGGTMEAADSIGYSWVHNFLSALLQPKALNGAANPARYFANLAMLVLCVSLGIAFWRISGTLGGRGHRKTIQIAGVGAVVYSLLIVTPMHDLMVTIGLLFALVAQLATVHALYLEGHRGLFAWGALSIALALLSATMYYGHLLYAFLPVVQKVGIASSVGWLLAVYYWQVGETREPVPLRESIA
jgi:hypothetical protein